MKHCIQVLLGLTVLGTGGELAQAQQRGNQPRNAVKAYERPALSPYLDLLRNDRGGFSSEYFREVRPRFQLRQAAGLSRRYDEALRQQQLQTRQDLGRLTRSLTSNLGGTGHTSGFMTHGRYFGTGTR